MSNLLKKSLSYILLLTLVLSLLTACSSSNSTQANDPDTNTSSESNENTGSDSVEEEDFASEVTTYTLMAPLFIELPDLEGEDLYEKMKEDFGIEWDITWVSSNDYDTKFQTVLSSGDIPDVVVSTNLLDLVLNQSIQEGAFADLTDYLGDFSNYPNLINNSTEGAFNYVTYEGRIMGIPRNRAALEMLIYVRKDWMDKFGYKVEDIETVWDWKDMIVDIARQDPDGNGKDDTVGFAAYGYTLSDSYLTDNMCSAFGAYNAQRDEDGGLYYHQMTDGWIDYVEFAHEMYKDGAVSKEFSVLNLTEANDMFASGLAVSFCRTGTWGWSYEDNLKTNLGIEDAEVIALPYLKGTNANTTAVQTTGVYGAYFLNAELDDYDIRKLLNFYEQTCNEEWHTYAFYGLEGRDYEVAEDGSKVATEYGSNNVEKYQFLQQVVMTIANNEMKLINVSAPKEFNDKIMEAALTYLEPEANIKINPFRALHSSSWATVWPKYEDTFRTNTVRAITGEMSIDEYRQYIHDLRSQDDMKQCWKEFAESYEELFPDGN